LTEARLRAVRGGMSAAIMGTTAKSVRSRLSTFWNGWGWVIKLTLSIGLLWFVMRKSSISLGQVRVAEPMYIALAILLSMIQPLVNIPRWSIVLRKLGYSIPLSKLSIYFYVGTFFSQVLPASVGGDAVRVFYLGRHEMPWRYRISSVVLDRLVALGGLVILYVLFFNLASTKVVGHLESEALYYFFLVSMGIGLLTVLAARGLSIFFLDDIQTSRLPGATQIAALLRLVRMPDGHLVGSVVVLIVLGVTVHLIGAFCLKLVLHAFGYAIHFVDVVAIAVILTLVQSLPISLGGWGAREFAAVYLLERVGVAKQDAFLVSLILGALFLVSAVPGLFVWVLTRSPRPPVPTEAS